MNFSLIDTQIRKYRSERLDLIRGIACLYIIAGHVAGWTGSAGWFFKFVRICTSFTQPGGETNAGVILFIVLSGYCIHRNRLECLTNKSVIDFYRKRIVRIMPLFLFGTIIGVLFWMLSFNADITSRCTATYAISLRAILLKITGINVIIPFAYSDTYLGNAPLVTVEVLLYLYAAYPLILLLEENFRRIWKVLFGLLWALVFLLSFKNGYYNWWNNACVISFLPFWYMGGVSNNHKNKGNLCAKLTISVLLYIVLYILLISVDGGNFDITILYLIAESRKLIMGFIFANIIEFFDVEKPVKIMTFGLKDIGSISFSLYAVHAPVAIFFIAAGADVMTVLIGIFLSGTVCYILVEKKLSDNLCHLDIRNMAERFK